MDLKLIVRGLWDRVGGWLLVVAGGFTLLLGWLGVSDTPLPSEQIPYVVSGGLVGIALVGIGSTLLISADLRDEWRKLDDIETALQALAEVAPRTTDGTGDDPDSTRSATPEAALASPRRNHRQSTAP